MTDLVEWLTAQLDADEATARGAAEGPKRWFPGAFNDPTIVLRTIAAHRAILARHQPDSTIADDPYCGWCNRTYPPITHGGSGRDNWPCPDLRALLSIYRDRPGFDPSWTVEDR